MLKRGVLVLVIVVFLGPGCQSAGSDRSEFSPSPEARDTASEGRVLAYIGGRAVRAGELLEPMIEASGGDVLSELVLDEMLARRLDTAEVVVSHEALDAEREILLRNLADDQDEAARLLSELRRRRGWGESRFAGLLRRNAGLRALVADRVTVTDAAVEQAYRLRHGPSRRVRLIVAVSLDDVRKLRQRVTDGGEPFGEIAALASTDASAAQGGLLSPIRPDDTSYPSAMRKAIEQLDIGEVSQPVAIDGGFALLRLEETLPGSGVELKAVEAELRLAVRSRAERVLMQQLARELVSGAELVVLDPMLKELWESRRASLLSPQ